VGIKPDIPVCDSFANILASTHQENNNIQNHEHINNLTRTSLNDYSKSNVPTNKDQNCET
jgi:hypothetical protein